MATVHWVLGIIGFFFMGLLGVAAAALKWWEQREFRRPNAIGEVWDEEGTKDAFTLDTFGWNNAQWKHEHPNPQKVRYKIKTGIFKGEFKECDIDDYIQYPRSGDEGKIIVEFNIKNRDSKLHKQLQKHRESTQQLIADKAILQQKVYDLDLNIEKKAERLIEVGKKGLVLLPTAKSKTGAKT